MDGIIIVNKPKEFTSNDVVRKVKGILKEKVGHTGTLDPNATGVLPLLIGKGTLISKYIINHNKKYKATIKLGERTNTADGEGNVIESKPVDKIKLTIENVNNVFSSLIGEQEQIPPMYSAIKLNGKKLYEYARMGKMVDVKSRKINIFSISLESILIDKNEIVFIIECSKGTYIRTICENIAEKLGTVGFMKELERLKVGDFCIENSFTIKEIESGNYNIISIEQFFINKNSIVIPEEKLKHFLNGVQISCNSKDGIYRVYNSLDKFIGIGVAKNILLKRDIIL